MGKPNQNNDRSSIYKYLNTEEIKEVEDRLFIAGNPISGYSIKYYRKARRSSVDVDYSGYSDEERCNTIYNGESISKEQ